MTVLVPFQVAYEGIVYGPGDKVTAPPEVVAEWAAAGWITGPATSWVC